jgi:competence protein ComEA
MRGPGKTLRALCAGLLLTASTLCAAGVEVNTASQADLESLKGIGPSLSGKLLDERQRAPFTDWADLLRRVRGIGRSSAARLSSAGLTVNGAPYEPAVAGSASEPARVAPP